MTHSILEPNQHIGAFRVLSCQKIHDLKCLVTIVQHRATGARIMHLGNDDSENLFCLAFSTPAPDSTGISHILEHCALCGSKTYPVKDPFFSMVRRSLNTFMNAFTGSDFTCYPAASQVPEDFYNLFKVYLDAVFYPRLDELSFLQEGIRKTIDDQGNLQFKGIVYNEMKGAYATAEKRLWSYLLARLLPKTSHRFDSGGNPKYIPDLSFKTLRRYHELHYHPSRCLFYLYGNIPLQEHLNFLQNRLLCNVAPRPILPQKSSQRRRATPNHFTHVYPSSEDLNISRPLFGISWWTGDLKSSEDLWIMSLLDELLMGSDAAPLKRQLIERNYCQQAHGCLESESPQIAYSLILKGCSTHDSRTLTKLVVRLLIDICKRGFDKDQITAAIHRLELQHLEIDSSHYPYGLALFWRAGLSYQYGADPHLALAVQDQFKVLKKLASQPESLRSHFARLLIENQHRSSVALKPDPHLAKKEQLDEMARLEKLQLKLSPFQKKRIEQQTKALEKSQSHCDDLSCLPLLLTKSIPRQTQQFHLISTPFEGGTCYYHRAHTNGFIYIDCFIPLPRNALSSQIAQNGLPSAALWRLFASFLPLMGTSKRSFAQNIEEIFAHSGGICADISCFASAIDEQFDHHLHLRIKGLKDKLPKLFALLSDVIRNTRFKDEARLSELLARQSLSLEQNLAQDATAYVMHAAASCANSKLARHLNHHLGFGYFKTVRSLYQRVCKDPKQLQSALIQPLCHLQMHLPSPKYLVITCEEEQWKEIHQKQFFGFDRLFKSVSKPIDEALPQCDQQPSAHEMGFPIAAQVASNALSLPSLNYAHSDFAHLQLLSQLLQHKALHPQIREKGGAYGSGALCRSDWRSFILYSARDPNIAVTRDVFIRSLQEAALKTCSDQELEEAKRVVIQQLDTPIQPGDRGTVAFAWQMRQQSSEMRIEHRKSLLRATGTRIRLCCERYLIPHLSTAGFTSAAEKAHLLKEIPHLALQKFEY